MNKHTFYKWVIIIPLCIIGAITLLFLLYQALFGTSGISITSQTPSAYNSSMMEKAFVPYTGASAVSESFSTRSSVSDDLSIETAAEVDQKIIKTGMLSLEVSYVSDTVASISSVAESAGGFVQYSSVSEQEDGTHAGNITIRIPFDQFESTMEQIKTYANLVSYESVSGTDVTEEYTDLEARLHNAQAQEQTYLEVLDLAKTVEDVLSVQYALAQVRQEIEIYEGHIKYLEDRTSLSTITISLTEETTVLLSNKDFRPWTTVKEAAHAFVVLVQSLINTLIWIVVVGGGILLPLALIIWGVWKLFRCVLLQKCKHHFFGKKTH